MDFTGGQWQAGDRLAMPSNKVNLHNMGLFFIPFFMRPLAALSPVWNMEQILNIILQDKVILQYCFRNYQTESVQ